MAAALTIAVLFAVSITIVRTASVAMRLTGLPQHVARFQCLSALTGTGFTTSESELIVNYPIRRRILSTLMIVGNLGLVSVAATFIVAFVDAGRDADAIIAQAIAIVVAIAIILVVAINKTLDHLMCNVIGVLLRRATSLGKRRYHRILQIADGYSIAEHTITDGVARRIADLPIDDAGLTLLAVRSGQSRQVQQPTEDPEITAGSILICYGSEAAHDAFEDLINPAAPTAE
ncbi:MAG: hypothetical protein MJE12_08315 [Alphaproteobacteria bacterium]|nr:hypothetical protein [Alphaproteobacteria bacterium]